MSGRPETADRLYIIDALAPFCDSLSEKTVNWSKVPFGSLERDHTLDPSICRRVEEQLRIYADRVAELGFNAVTLDDLAHLSCFDFYPESLKAKIDSYRAWYTRLIEICRSRGLAVFITTDIMFSNDYIFSATGWRDPPLLHLLGRSLRRLFRRFDHVKGVVFRLGESDGKDIRKDIREEFHSRLVIRTPSQARRYIATLLGVFEKYDRLMIVRTWTLGAFKVGDLMWNPRTYRGAFGGIDSDRLVVSHKYGDTDFQRYLDLNPLLFEGNTRKIVEFQARREYEGFGEFPSFAGYDYERFIERIKEHKRFAGAMVWCQTGGWSRFRRLTFLKDSSVWNELNTAVTIAMLRRGLDAEGAIREFCRRRLPASDPELFVRLIRLSDRVVERLWYIPEFSSRTLYFRRTRVPPLLWVFWDRVLINHAVRVTLRRFVQGRREAIRDGYRALYRIREMKRLARELHLEEDQFDFQYDTFKILAIAREYFFGTWSPGLGERIEREARAYEEKYPQGFVIERDFSPLRIGKNLLEVVFGLCVRTRSRYRLIDTLVIIRFTGWFYPLVKNWQRRRMPEFARRQAMGIQVLFK